MRREAICAFGLAFVLAPAVSAAGQVMPAEMTGTAQMSVEKGAIQSCGLRIVAVSQDAAPDLMAADVSFNLYRSGASLVKAGLRTFHTNTSSKSPSPKVAAISDFWLKAAGHPATSPDKTGIAKSESPTGYLFYLASSDSVSALFAAAYAKTPIQMGLRLSETDSEVVFSGTYKETKSELSEVKQCMDELLKSMWTDVGEEELKKP
jgi:hypothetical protein